MSSTFLPRRRIIGSRRSWACRLHFRDRQGEWWSAIVFLACAAVLAMPGDAFRTPTWAPFLRYHLTESFWTWAFTGIGTARLIALFVNGAMQSVTPFVRLASAALGAVCWSQVGTLLFEGGMAANGSPTLGVALFGVLALVEIGNVLMAAMDVRAQP